jgi:hypothetical protein
LRLLSLTSDLVELTFLHIYDVLEGLVLLIAILERDNVLTALVYLSLPFDTNLLYETPN